MFKKSKTIVETVIGLVAEFKELTTQLEKSFVVNGKEKRDHKQIKN
jgi:hypothetical protein